MTLICLRVATPCKVSSIGTAVQISLANALFLRVMFLGIFPCSVPAVIFLAQKSGRPPGMLPGTLTRRPHFTYPAAVLPGILPGWPTRKSHFTYPVVVLPGILPGWTTRRSHFTYPATGFSVLPTNRVGLPGGLPGKVEFFSRFLASYLPGGYFFAWDRSSPCSSLRSFTGP
jgi:hypothetical protein